MTEQQERTAIVLPTMSGANVSAMKMEGDLANLPQANGSLGNSLADVGPESWKSDARKEYSRAASAWTGQYLYKVSGATAPPEEVAARAKEFFAQPGDPPELIKEKQAARAEIERTMVSTLPPGRRPAAPAPTTTSDTSPGSDPWSQMKPVQ